MRTTILGVIAITSAMTFACTMTDTTTKMEPAKAETSAVKPSGVGFKSKLAVSRSAITTLVARRNATMSTGKLGVRSGGSTCGLSTGDTTCDSCLDTSCCTENKACVADADCTALIACGNACTDDACLRGCFGSHPSGAAILETLITCVETSCTSACGGGGGGGGGGGASACGFASGDPTCDSCLDTSCCADANACFADTDCTDYLDCAYGCSDAACAAACETAHPTGMAKLDAVSTCATTSCGTACGSVSGGGGSGGGGSGGSCGLTSGDPSCDACLDTSCCAQTTTCLGSADCVAVIGCYDTCSDAACAAACDAAHPTGASELEAVFTCAQGSCGTTCGL